MKNGFCKSLMLVLVLCAGLCGVAEGRQIMDMVGRTVTVPEVIRKAYGTAPPATYMIYAMDPKLMAGLNAPIDAAEKQYVDPYLYTLPVLGGWYGQGRVGNMESILAMGPDIILRWQWQQSTAADKKMDKVLASIDIPVVYIVLDEMADYPRAFRFLGELFGKSERAEILSGYAEDTLKTIAEFQKSMNKDQRVSVYYAEGVDGLFTECHTSIHAQLIPFCGGDNVHKCTQTGIYGMQPVSMEQILAYDPQVIISHDDLFLSRIDHDKRWKNMRAVREQRVYRIPRSPFNWFDRPPSFMRLLGMKWLARALYPDTYSIDMADETRAFFHLFLNVDLEEKEIRKLLFQ